jgi:hypothetical protein
VATGWVANQLRVATDAPFYNPDGCAQTDGYMTDASDPGVAIHHAALLAAFTARKPVTLWLQGCTGAGRPWIIGVQVGP